MAQIDTDHLKRTLGHPLLNSIFIDYAEKQKKHQHMNFWLAVEELRGIYDDVWLKIFANSTYHKYISTKIVAVSEAVNQEIFHALKMGQISVTLFDNAQREVFDAHIRDLLRNFLQSQEYHEQYEQLRKAALWVNVRNAKGVEETRGNIYCTITYGEETQTTTLASPQNINWRETDKVHKMEIIANQKNFVEISLYVRNQSIWQTDQLIGSVQILLKDVWDEKPYELWLSLYSTLTEFANVRLLVGVVLIHRPAIGLTVGELDFTNPLAACCSYGHYGAVKQLLNDGYPIDSRMEDSDRTPLHIAVIKNRAKITQLLLHKQADPNLVDAQCQTPLHLAAAFAPNLCHLLVAANARIDVKDLFENGQTPLHMLATHNYADALQYLIERGANINSQTLTGVTPLHKAILTESIESVRVLINAGADADLIAEEADGLSPYTLAESRKKASATAMEIFKILQSRKLSVPPSPLSLPRQM